MGELFFLMIFGIPLVPAVLLLNSRLAISDLNPPIPSKLCSKSSFGYHSQVAMRNADTWQFANQYLWKLTKKYFFVIVTVSEATLFCIFLLGLDIEQWIFSILLLQVALYAILIPIKMNKVLNETFDKHGFRREGK